MYVSELPVNEGKDQAPISYVVKDIIAAKAKNPAADVSALEAEIDQRVYALYGPIAEELRIVEGEA